MVYFDKLYSSLTIGIIDGITVTVVEHYLGPLGSEMKHEVKVKPVLWPVPSIESLWLGVKPENKVRRMKAFLSAMQTGSNPFIANPAAIPEHYLLICCTVRSVSVCLFVSLLLFSVGEKIDNGYRKIKNE